MTHFRSDLHQDRHSTMNSELRNTRPTTTKRGNSAIIRSEYEPDYDRLSEENHNRGLEYQRVPGSDRAESCPVKRPRSSPSSSNSSSSSFKTAARKNSRAPGKARSSTTNKKLKLAELLSIKRELTVIKVQIDELLDCVDKMDRQRKDCTECSVSKEVGAASSPHRGSVSSLERDSPEPGEASEEEPVYYQHYYTHRYTHRIPQHSSDPEDTL
ncbi:hypothetical protein NQD34_004275 [Periophthalmus magnuspinnatus]|uniref:uncharacterized protein si:dkey-234i14.2 n=1 Tax=Periophthalmus magnuspinnatus TaxID=409849 RepID=UPI00145A4E4F|nr:uncharacterized protein si:dkey-234i14.2 [Periophthalmus magnuspinnatus]KAJ0029278.1 hypothetical protein NQD34_004275 [Periophthalmus magnuspinnatus]